MKQNLQSKLAWGMWVLAAASTLAAAVLIGVLLIRSHQESIEKQLQATATSLITLGVSDFSKLQDLDDLNIFIQDALGMEQANKMIRIYDSNRQLIFSTVGLDYDLLPDELDPSVTQPKLQTLKGRHRRYQALVVPYRGRSNQKEFFLQVVIPLPRYSEILRSLWWQSLSLLLVLIVVSWILSRFLSLRLLRPVKTLADHLDAMDPKRPQSWRMLDLQEGGPYLHSIVQGVNNLNRKTREAIQDMEKMGRYVAHEMRTPLTILQGETETVLMRQDARSEDYQRVLQSSLEEVQRLNQTVDTVLQIGEARGQAVHLPRYSLALGPWLQEHYAAWCKTLGWNIELQLPQTGNLLVLTDPQLLYYLVDNLIRNIQKHTPAGTPCRLELLETSLGIQLLIEDEGPGVSPEELNSMNHPAVEGSFKGVGLHLCHTIADILGLNIRFQRRKSGGLIIRVRFPHENFSSEKEIDGTETIPKPVVSIHRSAG